MLKNCMQKAKRMISAAAFSNVGNIRSSHQDNYLLGADRCLLESQQKQMINNLVTNQSVFAGREGIFAVCDGMGGHAAGEVASRMAVQWLNYHYAVLIHGAYETIGRCLDDLNREICIHSARDPKLRDMGSTLAGIIISEHGLYGMNAGDSRIYRFSDSRLERISEDHTEGERLLKLKLLNQEEIEHFMPRKNLYKYLGYPGTLLADVKKLDRKQGDYYLICSDGVTDVLTDAQMEEMFWKGKDVCGIGKSLLQQALAAGDRCRDNVTLEVVQIGEQEEGRQ